MVAVHFAWICVFMSVLISTWDSVNGVTTIEEWKKNQNRFRETDFNEKDREHLKEHLKQEGVNPNRFQDEQLDFFYFKLHDNNHDNKLDGLELLSAFYHTVKHDMSEEEASTYHQKMENGETLWSVLAKAVVKSVDRILEDDDRDKDGYLDYVEYASSRTSLNVLRSSGKKQDEAK